MPKKPGGDSQVTSEVMKDRVVKAAIAHSGKPSKSRDSEQKAEQSETSLRTESQRKINLIWEVTQAIVTIMVVGSTLFIAGKLALSDATDRTVAFLLLSNAFFMIVTFYYQRTNHVRTGGVGGRNVDTDR